MINFTNICLRAGWCWRCLFRTLWYLRLLAAVDLLHKEGNLVRENITPSLVALMRMSNYHHQFLKEALGRDSEVICGLVWHVFRLQTLQCHSVLGNLRLLQIAMHPNNRYLAIMLALRWLRSCLCCKCMFPVQESTECNIFPADWKRLPKDQHDEAYDYLAEDYFVCYGCLPTFARTAEQLKITLYLGANATHSIPESMPSNIVDLEDQLRDRLERRIHLGRKDITFEQWANTSTLWREEWREQKPYGLGARMYSYKSSKEMKKLWEEARSCESNRPTNDVADRRCKKFKQSNPSY